jgi:hypothetical protein
MPKLDLHAVNNPIVKLVIEAMNGRKLSKTDLELFKHPEVKYATSQLFLNGWLVNARCSDRRIELVASSVYMAIKSIFC